MSAFAFTRSLGSESGVQLNPTVDASEKSILSGVADQNFAVAMRCLRGRIDGVFKVNRNDYLKKTGYGEPMSVSALNEAHTLVHEALLSGAREAVVYRLVTASASNKYVVAKLSNNLGGIDFSAEAELPSSSYLFAIKHHECFNDGIKVQVHANVKTSGATQVENRVFTIRIVDPKTNEKLYEFTGSSDNTAVDDYGNDYYLPNVVAARTENLELIVPPVADSRIPVANAAYGLDSNGFEKWVKSAPIIYFTEGGTGYTTADYLKARTALSDSAVGYNRIVTAGSQAPALILQMANLAYEVDKPLDVDVSGKLTKDEAIAFYSSLNIDSEYVNFYWHPVIADCPLGLNKRDYFGTSALHAAYTCARNANVNEYGFAPKQYPIAGKNFPISRARMKQVQVVDKFARSDLADNKINPVVYETYSGGSKFVFLDSLTSVKKSGSFIRLNSVVDRKCDIEERVTWLCKDALQLPMDVAIKIAKRGLLNILEGADISGWLQTSKDLGGKKYDFDVVASEQRPEDQMIVKVWACFTGTNRQTFITMTINKPN